jgi:hypothetical protein
MMYIVDLVSHAVDTDISAAKDGQPSYRRFANLGTGSRMSVVLKV